MGFRRVVRLMFLMVALAAAALGLAAPAAAADNRVHLDGGRTVLTVDRATLKVLADNDVSVAPIRGATANGRSFTFPITGGAVDATSLAGKIEHSGGLQFSEGGDRLRVQDFVIDTRKGVLTARVSGTNTRVPLLELDLGAAHIDRGHGTVVVSNVKASLTGEAADALNKTFDVTLFKKGLDIGVAKVTARF